MVTREHCALYSAVYAFAVQAADVGHRQRIDGGEEDEVAGELGQVAETRGERMCGGRGVAARRARRRPFEHCSPCALVQHSVPGWEDYV